MADLVKTLVLLRVIQVIRLKILIAILFLLFRVKAEREEAGKLSMEVQDAATKQVIKNQVVVIIQMAIVLYSDHLIKYEIKNE